MASERKDQVSAMGLFEGTDPPAVIAADGFGTITRNSVGNYSVSLNAPPIAPRQGIPQALPMGGALNKLSCVSEGDSVRVLSFDAFGAPTDCPLFGLTLERTSSPGSSDPLPVVPAGAGAGFGAAHVHPSTSPVADGSFLLVSLDTQVLNTDPANYVLAGGGLTVATPGLYALHQCANWQTGTTAGAGGYRTLVTGVNNIEQQIETTAVGQEASVGATRIVQLAGGEVITQAWAAPTGASNSLTIGAEDSYLSIQRVG